MSARPEIILASASPRRRELLARLGVPFVVRESGIEERPWPGEPPASYALRNAGDKARAVFAAVADKRGALVLAADTIVVADGRILEKPGDDEDARAMLRSLSDREHEVMTGLCLLTDARETGRVVRSLVRFRAVSEAEIAGYVATGEPMDKAGAYAIQGGAAPFVVGTTGSYTNIVGLPMEVLGDLLRAFGVAGA